jgi:plastocyanin
MVSSIRFDRAELTISANTDVTITADNTETGVPHSFSVYRTSAAQENLGKTDICTAPCTNVVTLNLPPGEYFFRCEVHPQQMTGTLIVQ